MVRYCFLLVGLAIPTMLATQEKPIPEPALAGLESLVQQDCSAALDQWTAKWTEATDAGKRVYLERAFAQLFELLGPTRAYDVVRVHDMGLRLKYIYVVLVHDYQPAYLMLALYMAPDGWRVIQVQLDTDAEDVFPRSLLENAGQHRDAEGDIDVALRAP